MLENLRSAEWARAHGLPVNPHRGNGPSITFFGPGGTIRRHIELNESDLRPRSPFRAADLAVPGTAHPRFLDAGAPALLVRQGELTDSLVTVGSTEQYWVFEDGELITKTILIIDADTVVGASQLAYDELGELAAEQWVPRSLMGPIDDPEDPQWEIRYTTPKDARIAPLPLALVLSACGEEARQSGCAAAIEDAVQAGIAAAPFAYMCIKWRILCDQARVRGSIFAIKVGIAIAACSGEGEWETSHPSRRDPSRCDDASKPSFLRPQYV
jgi:hypothetical protein